MHEKLRFNSSLFFFLWIFKRAFDALCHSTHFYGRPLVLEWANDTTEKSSSIVKTEAERVAAKTAQKFNKGMTTYYRLKWTFRDENKNVLNQS